MNDPLIGKTVDGYRVDALLGRGGMGIVYRARDTELDCDVALKMIAPELAGNETFLQHLRTEARLLANPRIRNCPYIVQVYAMRQATSGLYIAMEYVDGGSLKDRIARGPIPWKEAVPILNEVLLALVAAHGSDGESVVIHRDIKPANILLTGSGRVKVADFGLAKLRTGDETRTATRGAAGSLYYMSPEQVRGSSGIDHRTDLYSLGMTAYEMLYGLCPFDTSSSEYAIMGKIAEEKVRLPASPPLPEAVRNFVLKSVEKDPKRRFQTARDGIEALEEIEDVELVDIRPSTPSRRVSVRSAKKKSRKAVWLGTGVVSALAAVVLGYLWIAGTGSTEASTAIAGSDNRRLVSIETNPPGATVLLNNVVIGTSPIEGHDVGLELAPVRIELDGYESVDTTLRVAEGSGPTASRFVLRELDIPPPPARYASVHIRSDPSGAGVTVNGEPMEETTPFTYRGLDPGQTSIVVGKRGYREQEQRRDLVAGRTTELRFQLEEEQSAPQTAFLSVGAEPAGAVFVDGKPADGRTEISPGEHTVGCGEGEFTFEERLTIGPGESESVTCFFVRPVRVGVRGNPWGRIYLDDVLLQENAPTTLNLPVGDYTIEVNTSLRTTREGVQSLRIEPSTSTEDIVLEFHFE